MIASYALRNGFDKIMFIDSDQSWTWEQIKPILDSDKPIVAGVVALKRYPIQLNFTPLVRDLDIREPHQRIDYQFLINLSKKYPLTPEIEVQAIGTAFMCIDTAVLNHLARVSCTAPKFLVTGQPPAFDFFQTGVVNGLYFGEDWGFCAIAKRAGFSTFLNCNVTSTHHGQHAFSIDQNMTQRTSTTG
jgi:hypothetical protein